MIRRRRPEQSDDSSEGQTPEPATEGQQGPESDAGAQPEGADEPAAGSGTEGGGEAAASEPADQSTPAAEGAQAQAASGGRKRNRRRRGKGAASDTAGEASGDTAAAGEAAAAAGASDAEAGATPADSQGESATGDDAGATETPGGASAADDGAGGGESPGTAPPRRRGGRGLALLALLALVIALAAAGGAGWLGWRVLQLERQVAAVPQQREQALAPLASQEALDSVQQRLDRGLGSLEDVQQRLSDLANEQQRLQGEHQAVLDDLRTRLETAEAALDNLRDRRERDGADWRMAEVRYLVSIAVQRLAISGDVAGSVAALQAADQSLARMGDPRVIELRKQIVDDIEALQAVEPADVEGIALRIQNLAPRIPHLEPPAPPSPPAAEASAAADTPSEAEPQGWWASIRARLQSLVTVRREAEASGPAAPAAAAPEPAPSAELPAGERLLLALKDASRAALNQAPQAYRDAIDRALKLLDAEYAEAGAMVDRFRQALEELRARRVTTDLPDLGPTLERTQALAARLERGGSGAASQGDN